MNGSNFILCRCQRLTNLVRQISRLHSVTDRASKRYATKYSPGASPLSQSLDMKRNDFPRGDTVGPFQLGIGQSTLKKGEKIKKWSELSPGGKVLRTTARTTNLTVILLGAGLSALLVYSLVSELFSKNSPTVIYGNACERIKNSPEVARYLHGPLAFHNNPPSAIRPRHRNRHVISQIMVDANGQEHMIMTFYVQGRPLGPAPSGSELSYIEKVSDWMQDRVSTLRDLTLDESITWSQEHAERFWDRAKSLFKYLNGSPVPSPTLPPLPPVIETQKLEDSGTWTFAGIFSSLKGPKSSHSPSKTRAVNQIFTDGQVHAHLIRNQDGYFIFRYLLIDFPSTGDPSTFRVFIERTPGVRDNEPVMKWKSDS